jgi:hypothetical protein
MKLQSKIAVAAILATALATPAFAGPVGTSRNFQTAAPDSYTVAELQDAAQQARQDAMTGNKNNLEFRRKNYEIDQVIAKLQSGQPVDQAQIDESLQPVHVW